MQLSTARKIASKVVVLQKDYALHQQSKSVIRKARKRQRQSRKANR